MEIGLNYGVQFAKQSLCFFTFKNARSLKSISCINQDTCTTSEQFLHQIKPSFALCADPPACIQRIRVKHGLIFVSVAASRFGLYGVRSSLRTHKSVVHLDGLYDR
jgi:hypothetical protein